MSSQQQQQQPLSSTLKGVQSDLQGSNLQGSNLQGSNYQGTTSYGQGSTDPLMDKSGLTSGTYSGSGTSGTYTGTGTGSSLTSGTTTTGTYGTDANTVDNTTTNNESGGFGKTIMNASMPFIGPLRIFTFDPHATSTKLNLEENQLQYDVLIELPGIPKSNIKVQLEKNGIVEVFAARDIEDLNILLANQVDDSGDRANMKPKGEYHRRKFCVPSDANRDSLHAKIENGILDITMMKLGQDELARQRASNTRQHYSVE